MTNVDLQSGTLTANPSRNRLPRLHGVGILCGFAAGAWLGAAEAPTKLVSINVSPIVISFMMVLGVFLALDCAGAAARHLTSSRRHTQDSTLDRVGSPGGVHLGGGKYAHHLCYPQYRAEHRVSAVELE